MMMMVSMNTVATFCDFLGPRGVMIMIMMMTMIMYKMMMM